MERITPKLPNLDHALKNVAHLDSFPRKKEPLYNYNVVIVCGPPELYWTLFKSLEDCCFVCRFVFHSKILERDHSSERLMLAHLYTKKCELDLLFVNSNFDFDEDADKNHIFCSKTYNMFRKFDDNKSKLSTKNLTYFGVYDNTCRAIEHLHLLCHEILGRKCIRYLRGDSIVPNYQSIGLSSRMDLLEDRMNIIQDVFESK